MRVTLLYAWWAGLPLALLPLLAHPETPAPEGFAKAPLSPLARILMGIVQGRPSGSLNAASSAGTGRSMETALRSACREITQGAPYALDTSTRLDGCSSDGGRRVTYHLNLVRFDASREGTAAFMISARPALVRGICRNPDVPMLGQIGITLVFRYAGLGSKPVGEVSIAPGSCPRS